MPSDPAFLFYPGDYLRDTQCFSEKVQVAYDRIMCEHMRNICISNKQLKFFTKRLNEEELEELMVSLTKANGGYQIKWVAESIEKRRAYSESRRKNKQDNPQSYVKHMDNEIENENVSKKKKKNKTFDFSSIWERHPKKIGKKEAFGYFNTTVKTDEDFANIKKAIGNYLKYLENNQVEMKYTKSGCNWFDDWESWVDYKEEPVAGPGETKVYVNYDSLSKYVEKELGKMATDKMVREIMRFIPEKAWWVVDRFLKKRYPQGDHGQFGRIEAEILREK